MSASPPRALRRVALTGAAALIAAGLALPGAAQAQQVPGNAPFINSWLVSGPYDTAVADGIYGCTVPTVSNLARSATATASSALAPNPAAQLNDGDVRKQWVAEGDTAPWAKLTWASPISLNEVRIAQWGDGRHVNGAYQLTFTLADGSSVESPRVASTSGSPTSPTIYTHPSTLQGVVSVTVAVDPGLVPYPSITGLSEIEVYERSQPAEGKEPITPALGGQLTPGATDGKWEYFDDRVYNRNYDDYQDLYGYFSVKKGEDTRNKYVYAHSYVYSPEARKAFVNVGASGSYRLYVNDRCMTAPSTPAEVQKDQTRQEVELKAGWNKVLLQIQHTYTEDLNANGVPAAKDQNVAYLGFYGRISDANGNRIDGIQSSVEGPGKALSIDTQALKNQGGGEDSLPSGTLPTGYLEWPYVWNGSVTNNRYGVSASAFQFIASGGQPGYTWKLVDGALPDGLELTPDGRIADGFVNGKPDLASGKGIISASARIGDYKFTLAVTDASGATVNKEFTLTVKDRPNRDFEEGRVSALTHATPIYNYFVDPNYSVDQWAQRAQKQGHSLVALEALQQNYHWPSKFADPAHDRNQYMPKDANGKVVDGLKPFADAVRRYGMDLGIYYATEGGGLQHYSTDVFVQNVEDLLERYNPSYLYFDGPQAMPGANYDVMYSAVRNHGNDVVIDSNAWGEEFGDPDIRTDEASGMFSNAGANHLAKRTPVEPWKMIRTQNQQSPYYGQRDDFRMVAQETIMNAGRGYVDNNDQTVIDSRGPNWHSPTEMATRYPKGVQEFIDVREAMVDWWQPAAGINLHESITGTTPRFLPGYGYEDDGQGNYDKFAHPNAATGPQWGYATSRDNNIYLHIVKGPDGKKGFDAITGNSLDVGGIAHKVKSVTLLNTNKPVKSFKQDGASLAIDLSGIAADPIDTIIKIETDDKARKYQLTNLTVDAQPLDEGKLALSAGGYMKYPSLATSVEKVKFKSSSNKVAKVRKDGVVEPGADGTATVAITAESGGVKKATEVKVSVLNGVAFIGEDLTGAVLRLDGKEAFGTFGNGAAASYALDGRSVNGQSVRLDAADITWHTGTVALSGGTKTAPIAITEVDTFTIADGKVTMPHVSSTTRGVVWAEVKLGGKSVTSNRVFFDMLPTGNLAATAKATASDNSPSAAKLVDGIGIDAANLAGSGWSAPGEKASWVQFELGKTAVLSGVELKFNVANHRYVNAPKKINLQTSADGATWVDAGTVNGPGGQSYFGTINSYPLAGSAKYVRVSFPEGSQGSTLDLLEVAINGK
ncbi:discoidin domain-containing protein [Arthrobacter sp. HY1533]|uniref:discoidin domain-containing protein n=1 Tax=Arthrobacter sp. HY1533 TaxID=2970919 RepID=UPI0022B9FAA1|nr:discoidin domain-containing protein [Arthrobacter sp. HY1533]